MTGVAFDTLRFARALRDKAKLPPEQAEGLADAIAEAFQGDLVTKSDLRIEVSGLRADLADTRAEIIRWVAVLIGFQTLAILGAVFAFVKVLH